MRVRHFGNTANNAFHNILLLKHHAGIESELPIRMFGLRHAISAPAWEAVDFDVPDAAWVEQPDWSSIPEAVSVNAQYTDLGPAYRDTAGSGDSASASTSLSSLVSAARTRLLRPLRGQSWAQPLVALRDRQILATRPVLDEPVGAITLLYGLPSMFVEQVPHPAHRTVCLEHGTIRWVADGTRAESAARQAYREQVQQTSHLWVTNMDARTLEVAEDLAPGRWSAFPHPFMPDDRVPFPESATQRQKLLTSTSADHIVLLPASQNWSKYHDKGSMKALCAFVDLRRKGVDVGLVAIEWGHQVLESKSFLQSEGVARHVTWIPPMARFPLQRMMADVDVVWDQFGMDVFGALALRTLEQGTPLVSRGLQEAGERFIGGPVPWLPASNSDEIVAQTTAVIEHMNTHGRAAVIAQTRAAYRGWLLTRHSPFITAALQRARYAGILDGSFRSGDAVVDEWARMVDKTRGGVNG